MKQSLYLPILLAGLLAAAGVQAQSAPAAGSSDLPPKAGEASTQTQGAPNAATTNISGSGAAPAASKDAVRQEAQGMGAAAGTSSVPPKAGEASTVVQGAPNVDPAKPAARSRAEVVAELMGRRAAFEAHRKAMMSAGTTRMSMLELPPQ